MAKCVLVTGGAGYIGSHTVVEMINGGYDVVVIDNFVNAHSESLARMEEITGKKIVSYTVDISNKESLSEVFSKHQFFAVVHMAAYKAVGESVKTPLRYYRNNFISSINLLEELNAVLLRYFNPVGAHKSGKIGEDPQGTPKNLMPNIVQAAIGKRPYVTVFGNDYDTPDGTGVRDYTHVIDLSLGHVAALKKLEENCGCKIYNLGTGKGYSVLEMIKAVEKASGKSIAYKFAPRRDGDVGTCYSDASLAEKELGWKATRGLEEMCEDAWKWQKRNPQGFQTSIGLHED